MIPNLFSKQKIPKNIPFELDNKIKEFSKGNNKEIFLRKSFLYITNKWGGDRTNLFLKFNRVFQKDIFNIFRLEGYQHCTSMNFILRIMAVKSGMFKDSDISLVNTNSWYCFPHQYLRIKLSNKKFIDLDPWNYQFGVMYGKHGSGFDSIKLKSNLNKK